MEGIVGEANLSFGAVYDYYKSKDELILAAFSSAFQEILMREEPRGRAQMAETWRHSCTWQSGKRRYCTRPQIDEYWRGSGLLRQFPAQPRSRQPELMPNSVR
jgi:AcrR family transcriptional regulator